MLSSEAQVLTDVNEIGTLNQSVSNIERGRVGEGARERALEREMKRKRGRDR